MKMWKEMHYQYNGVKMSVKQASSIRIYNVGEGPYLMLGKLVARPLAIYWQ